MNRNDIFGVCVCVCVCVTGCGHQSNRCSVVNCFGCNTWNLGQRRELEKRRRWCLFASENWLQDILDVCVRGKQLEQSVKKKNKKIRYDKTN